MTKREQAHNPKRQFRREMERTGKVAKSGRQWRKFRKLMKAVAREQINKNIDKGIEDMRAGRWTILDPETLVTEETLEGIAQAGDNLGQELSSADLVVSGS